MWNSIKKFPMRLAKLAKAVTLLDKRKYLSFKNWGSLGLSMTSSIMNSIAKSISSVWLAKGIELIATSEARYPIRVFGGYFGFSLNAKELLFGSVAARSATRYFPIAASYFAKRASNAVFERVLGELIARANLSAEAVVSQERALSTHAGAYANSIVTSMASVFPASTDIIVGFLTAYSFLGEEALAGFSAYFVLNTVAELIAYTQLESVAHVTDTTFNNFLQEHRELANQQDIIIANGLEIFSQTHESKIINEVRKIKSSLINQEAAINAMVNIIPTTALFMIMFFWHRDNFSDTYAGQYIFMLNYLDLINNSSLAAASHIQSLSKAVVAEKEIKSFLLANPKLHSSLFRAPIESTDSNRLTLEFNRVNASFDNPPSLQNISFKIEPGQKVAIFGLSNSGKSAMVDMLGNLKVPKEGAITINGHNINSENVESFRKHIAYVPQEAKLFHTHSIAYNVLFGLGDSNLLDRLAKEETGPQLATKKTQRNHNNDEEANPLLPDNLSKNISSVLTPEELDVFNRVVQLVGLNHSKLSSLEPIKNISVADKRKLVIARGIARALALNSSLIILDEPDSDLDIQTATDILRGILNLEGKTVIIATRTLLPIFNDLDLILLMKQGKIVEAGRHEELILNGQEYTTLWGLQSSRAMSYLR